MGQIRAVIPPLVMIILMVMGISNLAVAQSPTADSAKANPDSLISESVVLEPVLYQAESDTTLVNVLLSEKNTVVRTGSPTVTLFKSVVFPGWGQYSNRKYVKAGLVFAVESYFIYKVIDNAQQASDWRRKWKDETDVNLRARYFREYTKYRDNRNSNLWITAAIVFISMFDAYVDAHLSSFPHQMDKPKKLSLEVTPEQTAQLRLAYHF